MSGHAMPNFKIQNLLTKSCLPCPVLSQDSKNVIFLMYNNYKCQKVYFKKWHHPYLFLPLQAKNSNRFEILYACCLHGVAIFGT